MAEVEDHGLRGQRAVRGGHRPRPRPELPPGGAVGPAVVPGLGVPESGATSASAAPRSRSGISRVLWSCWITARSLVMDAPVKLVIIRYYHEFYSLRPRPAFVLPPGATLPSRRPSGRTSHPRGRPGCLRGSIYWVLLSRGWFSVSKPLSEVDPDIYAGLRHPTGMFCRRP